MSLWHKDLPFSIGDVYGCPIEDNFVERKDDYNNPERDYKSFKQGTRSYQWLPGVNLVKL